MSETLLKIDFSQSSLPVEVGNISPDQQEIIDRVTANRDATAYLTTAELEELKVFISTGDNSVEFETFLTAQITEGLSSSDISGEPDNHSEKLDECDAYAQEILFGTNGVLRHLDISDTAKDHFSIAFSISLLEFIAPDGDIDIEEFIRIVNNQDSDFTQNIVTKLGLLQAVTDVSLDSGGEQNSICMDINKGSAFFSAIFSGNLNSAQVIKTELESANTPEPIEIDFLNLNTDILQKIETIARRSVETGILPPPEDIQDETISTEEKELSGFQKMINSIINGFKDFIKAISGFFSTKDSDNEDNGSPEAGSIPIEVEQESISKVGNFFQTHDSIILDTIPANILADLFGASDNTSDDAKSIVQHIVLFDGNNSIEDNLRSIFIDTLPDKQDTHRQVPVIERFMQEMRLYKGNAFSIKNADGSINIINFQLLIHHYQDFTVWKIDKIETEEIMLFQQYFAEQV